MAVFPWGHGRTRTESTEKKQHSTLEWFSREPTKQALADLIKQHSRTVSGGSSHGFDGRSRTNTVTSQRSQRSQHSRHCSRTSEGSAPRSPGTQSPSVPVRSPVDRPKSSKKSTLPPNGASERRFSKASIDSDTISKMVILSPPRFTPSRMTFRNRDVISPSRDHSPRVSISRPYDFQHVAHTEQVELNGLGRIDETELASKFNAIQGRQRSDSILRGIKTSDLGTVTPPMSARSPERPLSPYPVNDSTLPTTPPAPAPPPKDSPLVVQTSNSDIRMSRSVENFSRPTPRSPSTISPIKTTTSPPKLAPAPHINEAKSSHRDSMMFTSLPQVPSIGHAVSTQDDTARCMISAPLPSPPMDETLASYRTFHKRQSSSKGSLRHMSTFPSSRNPRHNMSLQDTQLLGIQEEVETIPRHRSEDLLSRHLQRQDSYTSDLVQVDDWEGAIDYAWDHEDDIYEGSNTIDHGYQTMPDDALIVVQQPSHDQVSSPSTPLMMMGPASATSNAIVAGVSSLITNDQDQTNNKTMSPTMIGLGIESQQASSVGTSSRPPALTVSTQSQAQNDIASRLPNTLSSALSKSSSQESIILSIASSILGTHRSSNSSVSPAEYVHMMKLEEATAMRNSASSQLEIATSKKARPESTCVPVALLQGFIDSQNVGESTVPETSRIIQRASNAYKVETKGPSPSPIQEQHEKRISESPIPIPHRRSSISAQTSPRRSRQRASTASSQRKPAGASYSLFPTAAPPVPIS